MGDKTPLAYWTFVRLSPGTPTRRKSRPGPLRALAVPGGKRSAQYPDLPTIGEFYPGYENSI